MVIEKNDSFATNKFWNSITSAYPSKSKKIAITVISTNCHPFNKLASIKHTKGYKNQKKQHIKTSQKKKLKKKIDIWFSTLRDNKKIP